MFAVTRVRGFRITTLDPEGIRHTFPSGVGTAPLNPENPKVVVENRPVEGLKNPKFVSDPLGTKRTRPSGNKTLPNHVPPVAPTFPNEGREAKAHQLGTGCVDALDVAEIHA
jgi:hypothetical protein